MNSKERYFYFGEADIATTGEACMFPLSSFLGITPADANRASLHFNSRNGAATDDIVTITRNNGAGAAGFKAFCEEMVGLLQTQKVFTVVVDGETDVKALPHSANSCGVATEA